MKESINLHVPANVLLILGRTGSPPSATEDRFEAIMLHTPFANRHLSREISHSHLWRLVTGFWRGDGGSGGDESGAL